MTAAAGIVGLMLFGYWAANKGAPHRQYRGHQAEVHAVDIDETSQLVASGGEDGLRVWSIDDLSELHRCPGRIQAVRFLPGNRLMVADALSGIQILSTSDWYVEQCLGEAAVRIVAEASRDGKWLAASFSNLPANDGDRPSAYDIHVWKLDGKTPQESILRAHEGPIVGLAIDPGSRRLISKSADTTVRIWDLDAEIELAQRGQVYSRPWHQTAECRVGCSFSPDGAKVLTDQRLSPAGSLEPVELLGGAELPTTWAGVFSTNGLWIATGHDDGAVRLWDARSLQQIGQVDAFVNHTAVYAVRFSPDGRLLATAGKGIVPGFDALARRVQAQDTTIRIWRTARIIQKP